MQDQKHRGNHLREHIVNLSWLYHGRWIASKYLGFVLYWNNRGNHAVW